MTRGAPRSTLSSSSAASDVYKRQVEYRVQAGISKVLDAQERFQADYELYLRLDAPPEFTDPTAPPGAQAMALTDLPSGSCPSPSFHSMECVELLEFECCLDRREGKIYLGFNWVVTFRERLGLQRFPFDSQLLTMRITLGSVGGHPADPVPWDTENAVPHAFYFPEELRGEEDLAVYYGGDSWLLKVVEMEVLEGAMLEVRVLAERKPDFYMWNVLLLNFMMVTVNCAVVGIHQDELASRLGVTLTLMLTAIAFKFVLMSTMPVVSYLTLLDCYVIMSFGWLFASCFESYLASTVLSEAADHWINAVGLSLWFAIHVCIVVAAKCGYFRVKDQQEVKDQRARSMQEIGARAIGQKKTQKTTQ
eukprot:TRINITY_DN8435_c0_g1_i1.p1 TRINITY_DN8435_c0_g1~~TRINITY_DN8435_c0_g1_i1.p1  ORF type:complete len:363 (-),score=90.04 TRINITY_DN8435_c0_g1_i1:90-1178(-)